MTRAPGALSRSTTIRRGTTALSTLSVPTRNTGCASARAAPPPWSRRRAGGRSSDLFEVAAALAALARQHELLHRLRLDLTNPLARQTQLITTLLKGLVPRAVDPEAHPDHLLLARREEREDLPRLLGEAGARDLLDRRERSTVRDEIAQVLAAVVPDRQIQADRLAIGREDGPHLVDGYLHPAGDLVCVRFTTLLLDEQAADPPDLLQGLAHVDGNTNRAPVIGDRAVDRLPDPPHRIGRELVAAPVLELVHRAHHADVALLDQVDQLEAVILVLLGDAHHEPQVRLHELAFRPLGVALGLVDGAQRCFDRGPTGASPHEVALLPEA